MTARATRTFKLPEPKDIHRDQVTAFVELLGHDPNKVIRLRMHPRSIEVDLLPPRRDIAKLTIIHVIVDPRQEVDE